MASEPPQDPLPSAYAQLRPELSQGDIVQGLPPCVLDYPITFCRPGNKPGQAHYAPISEATRTRPFSSGTEILHATGREPGLGMVIWEDCQIDKMKSQHKDESKWYVAVAPIFSLKSVPDEESRQTIRDGRRMAFFPLPALPALAIDEAYVDLRLIWPIKQRAVADRVIAISAETKSALYGRLLQFLTDRRFATEILCPHCGQPINAEAFMVPAT